MSRSTRCLFALLALMAPALSPAAADWTKVKAGISADEAAGVLGQPLIRTYGRGVQMWFYDGCGEIAFVGGGRALGWTEPKPTQESLSRPVENDVMFRPVVRLPTLRSVNPQRQVTYGDPSDTGFRFRR